MLKPLVQCVLTQIIFGLKAIGDGIIKLALTIIKMEDGKLPIVEEIILQDIGTILHADTNG
jgi:hypothetical protein